MCNRRPGLDSEEYQKLYKKTTSARGIINRMIKDNHLDAICGVTTGPAWCIDLLNGDYGNGYSFSSPAAMAGFPHITVPMGYVHYLPVGFSFVGTAFEEHKLIKLAYAFEQHIQARRIPEYREDILDLK